MCAPHGGQMQPSCEEVVPDSDESDLEVDLSEDDSDGGNGISLQMNIN